MYDTLMGQSLPTAVWFVVEHNHLPIAQTYNSTKERKNMTFKKQKNGTENDFVLTENAHVPAPVPLRLQDDGRQRVHEVFEEGIL